MRINPILNNNINFGYNKEVNDELKRSLKKQKNDKSKYILEIQKFCNTTEDKIIKYEKAKKQPELIYFMAETLIGTKMKLADIVDEKFPQLFFRKKEVFHYKYKNEVKDADCDWRADMIKNLEALALTDEQSEKLEDMENRTNKVAEESQNSEETDEQQNSEKLRNAMNSKIEDVDEQGLISLFKPNPDSPRGFESVGGMKMLKEILTEKVIEPLQNPKQAQLDLEEYGRKYPRGIMLFGPPGCGKTFITQALAMETDLPMYELKIGEVGSMYINATSNNFEEAFATAALKAKNTGKPVFMFIDEIDSLVSETDRSPSQEDLKDRSTLLNLIENARGRGIFVVSATNKYNIVDTAVKRRFDEQIYVGLPDYQSRMSILQNVLATRAKASELLNNDSDLELVVNNLEGYSIDDICIIVDQASDTARKDGRRQLKASDFDTPIIENSQRKVNEKLYLPSAKQPKIGFQKNLKEQPL